MSACIHLPLSFSETDLRETRAIIIDMKILSKVGLVILLSLLIAAGTPAALAQEEDTQGSPPPGLPRFERLFDEEGWAQNSFHAGIQDSIGFLWFGTNEGLLRFDGYQLKSFKHDPSRPDSLANNTIYSLVEDQNGMIWLGTAGGGLNRFDPHTESFTHYQHDPDDPNSLASNNANVLLEDDQGYIWIGTDGGGLDKFDPQAETFTHYKHDPDNPDSLSNDTMWFLHQDRAGHIWIATFGGGLDRLDPESGIFTHFRHDPNDPTSLASDIVGEINEDAKGYIWSGGWEGLNKLDPISGEVTRFTHDPEDPSAIGSNIVFDIYPDREGDLWIGSYGGGLSRFNPATGTASNYSHDPNDPATLSSDLVWFVLQDQGGLLWIGTEGGLNRFDPRTEAFGYYNANANSPVTLADSFIRTIAEDEEQNLWLGGTTGAAIQKVDRASGTLTNYIDDPEDPNSPADYSQRIVVDRTGIVWSGTYGQGLDRLDPTTEMFSNYAHDPDDPSTISDNIVTDIYEDRAGNLWIGTSAGLNRLDQESGQFVRYQHDPHDLSSISDSRVQDIYEDRLGNMWVGTTNGLNKMLPDGAGFERYYHDQEDPNSLAHNTVYVLLEDSAGMLWVGTDGGLNRLDVRSGEFSRFAEEDGLPSNSIQCILEDSSGDLWISSRRGLSRFNPEKPLLRNYTFSDGLQGNDFGRGSCTKLSSGELAFGGSNGVNIFFPEQITDNTHVPPIVLTQFTKSNEPAPQMQAFWELTNLELSYQDSVVGFEFTALDFANPKNNRYAYILEGFDEDWIYVDGDRRFATYTNLDPGEYVFRVKGSNSDGLWNEEGLSIEAVVASPWWATWWAYALYLLIAIGAVYGFVTWRLRSSAAQRRHLESQVTDRTQALGERVKELNCLYGISGLVNTPGISLDEILQGTVDLIPPSWQYPEVTRARISLDERVFTSENFAESPWKQATDIIVQGTRGGSVEVFYMEERPPFDEGPFQQEERNLINAIAEQLGEVVERKQMDEMIQLRLRLVQFAEQHSLEELLTKTLDEVETLTGSLVSFFHFVEDDQKNLTLQAWSTRTSRDFCQAEGQGLHYSLDEAGVWVDCVHQRQSVIHNDYANLPHRKGMPDGHAHLVRELVVPVFRDEKIVAILGVGNKPQDYTDRDVKTVTYVTEVIWEIVERKQAEEKLQISENRWRSLTETSPDHILTLDRDLNITFANFASPGLTVKELIGTPLYSYVDDHRQAEIRSILEEVVKTGTPNSYETVYHVPDGHDIFYESHVSARLHPESKEVIGLTVSSRNITDRVVMEAQRERLAALEERERIGRELHDDLGQVMGYVSVQAQTASQRLDNGEVNEATGILNRLVEVAQKASRDVRGYILGIRTQEYQPQPNFFAELEQFLDTQRQHHGLETQVSLPHGWQDSPFVPEVETQLLRIIQEALTNVRKHAGVNIVHLTFTETADEVQVIIEDEGRGFEINDGTESTEAVKIG